jgi:hypothetical protein
VPESAQCASHIGQRVRIQRRSVVGIGARCISTIWPGRVQDASRSLSAVIPPLVPFQPTIVVDPVEAVRPVEDGGARSGQRIGSVVNSPMVDIMSALSSE